MKKLFALAFVATLLVSGVALAEYPDDCLGEGEPSGTDCMGITYEGCCDALGNVLWCDDGQLYCLNCSGQDAFCGWMVGYGDWYGCMDTETGEDPSGENPIDCVSCDPPCGEGEICVGGVCEVCTPDCNGKQCGSDGCGGTCGECAGECVDGLCHQGPGCEPNDGPGCGGCPCEACVCELDAYCCDTAWDSICVGECINDCGGCASIDTCGNGTCEGIENCSNCPDDCGCADGQTCANGTCCTPFCGGQNCGDDGCGGSCGECAEGETCMSGVCTAPVAGPGCEATEGVAGCGGCDCEACVCEADSYCCETEWDAICVDECIGCGFCMPEATCGNALCEAGEDCGTCAGDCPCAPGFACEEGVCVEGQCTPDCDGKDCGDDGCGGSCGECGVGEICEDGACVLCEPDCTDLECGDDGCGGSCGTCDDGFKCEAGLCVEDICTPDCEGKVCGDDGCGGSCGDCAEGEECIDGACVMPVSSCEGLCGGAADTCFCDEECFENGDCCEDVCDFCGDLEGCGGCTPMCEGLDCGDDGCGGTCGDCAEGFTCEEGLCVEEACVPMCDGKECGDDGCGGSCGECTTGECVEGLCECVPNCEGLLCGEDGCGGSCGECAEGETCDMGACVPEMEADVVAGDTTGDTSGEGGETTDDGGSDGGCSATGTGGSSSLFLVLFALLALAGVRRQYA